MDAVDRFKHLRKKLRQKLGAAAISREVDRHLSHAASIQLVLETSRHETLLGHKLNAESLAALRDELPISLMRATIAASKTQKSIPHDRTQND